MPTDHLSGTPSIPSFDFFDATVCLEVHALHLDARGHPTEHIAILTVDAPASPSIMLFLTLFAKYVRIGREALSNIQPIGCSRGASVIARSRADASMGRLFGQRIVFSAETDPSRVHGLLAYDS